MESGWDRTEIGLVQGLIMVNSRRLIEIRQREPFVAMGPSSAQTRGGYFIISNVKHRGRYNPIYDDNPFSAHLQLKTSSSRLLGPTMCKALK